MANAFAKKTYTQGDVRTGISDALVDALGRPINLTGCTVCFHAQDSAQAFGSGIYAILGCASIDGDPEKGLVTYQWSAHDLDAVGLYYYWWVVKDTLGAVEHFPADGRKRAFEVITKP